MRKLYSYVLPFPLLLCEPRTTVPVVREMRRDWRYQRGNQNP